MQPQQSLLMSFRRLPLLCTLSTMGFASLLALSACSQPVPKKETTQETQAQNTQTKNTQASTATTQAASTNAPTVASQTIAASTAASTTISASSAAATTVQVQNVSQHFNGNNEIEKRLKGALPEISYSTDNLTAQAQATNAAQFGKNTNPTATSLTNNKNGDSASAVTATTTNQSTITNQKIDKEQALNTKIQALLNWHQFAIGAVDGKWGMNTVKAMQAFQQAHNLPVTNKMNEQTWQALSDNANFNSQPVLVNYTLTEADINVPIVKIPATAAAKAKLNTMGYERLTEALAEKFHIDEQYLKRLNPNANFKVGEIITVYNPGQPNLNAITRLIADKTKQQLFAYDSQARLIAVYPTTVGSSATPSPTGTHEVKTRVLKPNYTHTDKNTKQKDILQPGANNPVGLVWLGLDKEGYGIHGSPNPEAISRQASEGCIRLTNWDALGLYGTIQDGAKVEFK